MINALVLDFVTRARLKKLSRQPGVADLSDGFSSSTGNSRDPNRLHTAAPRNRAIDFSRGTTIDLRHPSDAAKWSRPAPLSSRDDTKMAEAEFTASASSHLAVEVTVEVIEHSDTKLDSPGYDNLQSRISTPTSPLVAKSHPLESIPSQPLDGHSKRRLANEAAVQGDQYPRDRVAWYDSPHDSKQWDAHPRIRGAEDLTLPRPPPPSSPHDALHSPTKRGRWPMNSRLLSPFRSTESEVLPTAGPRRMSLPPGHSEIHLQNLPSPTSGASNHGPRPSTAGTESRRSESRNYDPTQSYPWETVLPTQHE